MCNCSDFSIVIVSSEILLWRKNNYYDQITQTLATEIWHFPLGYSK